MNNIPEYVQNALDEWDALAFYAYALYAKYGRLVVSLEPDPDNPGAARIAVTYDYRNGKPDEKTAELLAGYDPQYEIIVQFVDEAGNVRTQRLKTAPGARHPRRVFFFEMLRRMSEEPETIGPGDLPSWFIEAAEKLGALQAARENPAN